MEMERDQLSVIPEEPELSVEHVLSNLNWFTSFQIELLSAVDSRQRSPASRSVSPKMSKISYQQSQPIASETNDNTDTLQKKITEIFTTKL